MKVIIKISKRLKRLRSYPGFIGRKPSESCGLKNAYISIKRINPNRRLFHVCAYLRECGYACFVDLSFAQFMNMDPYGLKAVNSGNVYPARKGDTVPYDLVVTDNGTSPDAGQTITLDYSVFDPEIDYSRAMFFPIHFHPDFMNRVVETSVLNKARSDGKRKIGILFAGNCDKESYDREETRKRFNIHTRWDIFSHLAENFPPSDIFIPGNLEDFTQARNSGRLADKLVLIDINVFKIPQADWFDLLEDTDFFIHLPGYIQPWCHNQIESMASGAIPITEFPHLFNPALRNGDNAITYREKDELLDILQGITHGNITVEEIGKLRENVLSYYDEHFSFAAFQNELSKALASKEQIERLYICAGDFSLPGESLSRQSEHA